MGNIIMFILGGYILYYAGNIIYDLFIHKEAVLATEEEGEIVNLNRYTEPNDIQNVDIEDVENVELPSSFTADEDQLSDEGVEQRVDTNQLISNFEQEKEISNFNASLEEERKILEQENQEKKQLANHLISTIKIPADKIISKTKQVISNVLDDDSFDNYLHIATSHVVLESNNNGHKVFKSTL